MDQGQESPSPDTVVLPLLRDLSDQAGAVLGRAFQDDPIQSWNFPNDARRAAILPLVFAALVRGVAASGGYITTIADHSGVALWSPPGTDIKSSAIMRAYGLDLPRIVLATSLSRVPGVVSFFGTLARRRKANVPEPHWYLAAQGVDPPYQGRGLGKALVRDGLDRADMDGKIAYLETETESNVGFYQALGFDVVEKITMDRLNLPMWLMARHPGRAEAAGPHSSVVTMVGTEPAGGFHRERPYDPDAPPVGFAERFVGLMPASAKDSMPAGDFRDWPAIDAWAAEIAAELQALEAAG